MIYSTEEGGNERYNLTAAIRTQRHARTRAVPKLFCLSLQGLGFLFRTRGQLETKFLSCGSPGGPAPQIDG